VYASWPLEKRELHGRLHSVRIRLGCELWSARYIELVEPLDAAGACRLLDISHHTLQAVERGPKWPDLATFVRVAALTGRRLVLTSQEAGLRAPPWPFPPPPGAAPEAAPDDGADR
jgi:hypothetical protein